MNPQGHYTTVRCHDIQGAGGRLKDGTGTFTHATHTFSCGPFSADDLPQVDSYYNLNGEHAGNYYEFPGWKCVASGQTSDFKER